MFTSPSLFRRIFFKMGLNFRGVALYPSPSALNTRCGILYHKDFDGGWGVRAAARSFKVTPSFILAEVTPFPECPMRNTLPQRVGKRAAAPSLAVRWSRSFLQRLHPNGKRCLFLLTLSFANCKRNRSFLVLCFCTVI